MKAIVNRTYGSPDVLKLEEVAKPVAQDGQVLVNVKPVIDRCFPLVGVAEASRYLETGHARGKVMIEVAGRAS